MLYSKKMLVMKSILAASQFELIHDFLTLLRNGFFGAAHGWAGGKKARPP